MARMVREFVEIGGELPLSSLVDRLTALMATLPEGVEDAVVRAQGDAFFGRTLQLTFRRPRTPAERMRDERYDTAIQQAA